MGRKTQMNHLTTPELLAQVNPDNLRLEEDFLNYLTSLRRSPTTVFGYKNDLDILFVYVLQHLDNKPFIYIKKREFVAFQNWLINENGNSPARVRRIKAVISSLSNYIENVLDDEPEYKDYHSVIRKIENPVNQPVRKKTIFTDEQMDWLLDDLTEAKKYCQACVLALALFSGRRKSELVRFKVDDFKDENLVCDGALYRTSEPIKTKGRGLGKYMYCFTLAKRFKPYLDNWLTQREIMGVDSIWLFPRDDDPTQQMRVSTLNSYAKTFSEMLGKDFYWHALRHAFTSNLVRAGLPDSVIQEIVGWDSADMVRVYTDIPKEEMLAMWFTDGEIDTSRAKKLDQM